MTTFRVMTYNVRYFGHGTRGIASTSTAVHRIAAALSRLSPLPDLVCLQEVETASLRSTWLHPRRHPAETQLDRLLEALHQALASNGTGRGEVFDGHYFPAHNYRITDKTSFYTTGLAILVRRPLRLSRHNAGQPFDLTHRRARQRTHATSGQKPWLKQTRICAHAAFEHPSGQTIDLFNTHLSLPSFTNPDFWRLGPRMGYGPNQLEEARQLVEFVNRERASDRFLVMGDLNALPASPVYQYLSQTHGWVDPLASELGDPEALLRFPTAGFLHLRMHLDHFLLGPGIQCHDLDGTRPFGDELSPFHGLSDHIPLIGRFTL